jgi:hypothetical protein
MAEGLCINCGIDSFASKGPAGAGAATKPESAQIDAWKAYQAAHKDDSSKLTRRQFFEKEFSRSGSNGGGADVKGKAPKGAQEFFDWLVHHQLKVKTLPPNEEDA